MNNESAKKNRRAPGAEPLPAGATPVNARPLSGNAGNAQSSTLSGSARARNGATQQGSAPVNGKAKNPSPAPRSTDRRVTGYTRVKSGELKRRSVTRTPDMSHPDAKVSRPNVTVGSLPTAKERPYVAALTVEPRVRTVTDTKKTPFPYAIIFLSLLCSVLFMYMIFNYVEINERTAAIADLKSEITSLDKEENDLNTALDKKNDLAYIEKVAREELGMVKIDEVMKKYITMDPGDIINSYR